MGNQLSTSSLTELHLQDLGEGLTQDKVIGRGRLLKSVSCWTENSRLVVVKVYIKRPEDSSLMLAPYHEILKNSQTKLTLSSQPNVLFYHRIVETDKAAYLERQYMYSNLADRISTRPFFSLCGKKWISFQILKSLVQIHSQQVYHGDIKAENIVSTGWDWIFLTDFAPYKKTMLPIDDPSDFYYYFTTEKKICNVAPERFVTKNEAILNPNESFDVFSTGCVLAQLFLDGTSLFDLPQLLEYKKGDTTHLKTFLSRIQNEDIVEMITSMLHLDPKQRPSASDLIKNCKVFDEKFEILFDFLKDTNVMDSDARISHLDVHLDRIIKELDNSKDHFDIVASFLCSSFRTAKDVNQRIKGLVLCQKLNPYCNDYTKFQRFIPYTCVSLSDTNSFVKSTAIRTLTHVIMSTQQNGEANLFVDYILPILKGLVNDVSDLVRVTFAEHLPIIVFHAKRMLELSQIGGNSNNFDQEMNTLHDEISSLILILSTDSFTGVKRALMKNSLFLTLFFGKRRTCEFLLPVLVTFLNSREWLLRYSFFEKIASIGIFVGYKNLKEYVLPCLFQALYDVEEFVVEQSLAGLSSCVPLLKLQDIISIGLLVTPMLHHPNSWIRYTCISLLCAMSKQLGFTDSSLFLVPIVRPHLSYDVLIEQGALISTCKPCLSRLLFDKFVKIAHVQKPDAPWPSKMLQNVSQEELEVLNLMKGYLGEVAKTMEAKMWDSKSESEPTPHVIKLDLKKDLRVSMSSKVNRKNVFGQLISYSNEHKKSISQIATHKNYFVSGGGDVCVKVWSLEKLEFLLNSKFTLQLNTKVSNRINSVAIHDEKVCAATDKGLLYMFDMNSTPSLFQGYTIGNEFSTWVQEPLEKVNGMSINVMQSGMYNKLLVCGNQNGILTGIDTRMHKEAFKWDNQIQYGPITSLVWDENWMLTGTQRGYMTLWDLRYKIKVESWKVTNSPIHKFGHVKNDACPNVLVCSDSTSILQLSLDTLKVVKQFKYGKDELETTDDPYGIKDLEIRNASTNSCFVFEDGTFLSGGSDKKVRFWNPTIPDQSNVLIGRVQDEYSTFVSKMEKNVQVVEEIVQTIPSKSRIKLSLQSPSAHSDAITDLTYTSGSNVITASRDGGIKIWN